MKIIEAINSLISTVALVYFAYGTWRIDRTLSKVERHLENMNQETSHISTLIDQWSRNDP